MSMINVLSKEVAETLHQQGFNYRIQKIDKKEVFTFIENPELLKFLNQKFSNRDFFISKTMNF